MTISKMVKMLNVHPHDVRDYMNLLVAELVQMPEAEQGLSERHVRKAVEIVARKHRLFLEFMTVEIARCKDIPVMEHPFMQMLAESSYAAFHEIASDIRDCPFQRRGKSF